MTFGWKTTENFLQSLELKARLLASRKISSTGKFVIPKYKRTSNLNSHVLFVSVLTLRCRFHIPHSF